MGFCGLYGLVNAGLQCLLVLLAAHFKFGHLHFAFELEVEDFQLAFKLELLLRLSHFGLGLAVLCLDIGLRLHGLNLRLALI